MASQNHSFTGHTAEIIKKLSQAIKEVDTSVSASLRDHRRYLYLIERLANEMRNQIDTWIDEEDASAQSDSALVAGVNREFGLSPEDSTPTQQSFARNERLIDLRSAPPHHRYDRMIPPQIGARFGEFPAMLPAPPLTESACSLGFVPPPQYTAIASSPPRDAARYEDLVTGEDEEEHLDAFPTQGAQMIQMEAEADGRDAYWGSNESTAVDYSSSQPNEDE